MQIHMKRLLSIFLIVLIIFNTVPLPISEAKAVSPDYVTDGSYDTYYDFCQNTAGQDNYIYISKNSTQIMCCVSDTLQTGYIKGGRRYYYDTDTMALISSEILQYYQTNAAPGINGFYNHPDYLSVNGIVPDFDSSDWTNYPFIELDAGPQDYYILAKGPSSNGLALIKITCENLGIETQAKYDKILADVMIDKGTCSSTVSGTALIQRTGYTTSNYANSFLHLYSASTTKPIITFYQLPNTVDINLDYEELIPFATITQNIAEYFISILY